jgi:diguanylate cyclase (GGDEF)-like protein
MGWYWSSTGMAVAATAPLFAALAWYAWRQRRASAARSLALVLTAGTWWTLAYALELSGRDLATVRLWGDLKYLGILLLPPTWVLFVLQYTNRTHWIRPWLPAAFAVVPVLTVAVLAHGGTHDLIRWYPPMVLGRDIPSAEVGPLFWALIGYSYTLLGGAALLLVHACLTGPRAYRRQGWVMTAAWVVVLLANLLHILRIGPFALLDPTPFALLAMSFVLEWGVVRHGLLPIVPVARDMVLDRMSDGVVVLDAYQRIVDVNPSARRALGLGTQEGTGVPAADLLPVAGPLDGERAAEVRLEPPGGPRDYEVASSPLLDVDGRASGHILVLRDITDRKRAEARLAQLALHDQLTGLANRKLLEERLAALTRVGCAFTVLFCDLDRFKRINDRLGHDAGDQALLEIARRLTQLAGGDDVVARLGGDEFVVVLKGGESSDEAHRLGQAAVAAIARPLTLGRHELYLTASVGVARSPEQGLDPAALLRQADQAMYRAKARGGNRVQLRARTVPDDRPGWLQLERDLHEFGSRDELELWYQPITSLADGRTTAMEALLRWRHPTHGLLQPDLFLPVAEQTDLARALGSWVLAEACGEATRWRGLDGPPPAVSVNLSARQCDARLVDEVGAVLRRTGLDPGALTLEITETAVLQPGEETLQLLHDLRGLGVGIATDDFGTGYTSLEQLRHYPLDVLKIDRSYVTGMTRRAEDHTIVGAMITLAHDLGLRVVAEGVETDDQRRLLRDLGCDAAQGYLYSHPLPQPRVAAYLAGTG